MRRNILDLEHSSLFGFNRAACALALLTVVLVTACRGDDRHPTTRTATAQPRQTAPRRTAASSMPECNSDKTVACFRDTAYLHHDPFEPTPTSSTRWMWFGSAGDSLEFFAKVRHTPRNGPGLPRHEPRSRTRFPER